MQLVKSCCIANFYATFQKLFFTKIALKLRYFCKKMPNFRALGAMPPELNNNPPIANFWLRPWSYSDTDATEPRPCGHSLV